MPAPVTVALNIVGNTAKANASLLKLGSSLKGTGGLADKLKGGVRNLGAAFKNLATSTVGTIAQLFALHKVLKTVNESVDSLAEFSHEMATVQAMSGASASAMEEMKRAALDLGATTMFTAKQAAEGFTFFAKAGLSTRDALKAIAPTLDLAAAANMEVGRTADITTNIMTAFQMGFENTEDAIDDLATILSSANTDMTQLGDAMKYSGAIANSLNVPMNETAAAIGVLSDAGLQGSMAGTGLRQVLTKLIKPNQEAREAMHQMGLTAQDLNPAFNDLEDIFNKLSEAQMSTTQASAIFQQRAAGAATVLANNVDRFRELTAATEENEGATKKMAEIMRGSLKGAFALASSAFDGFIQAVGDAGVKDALRSVGVFLENIFTKLKELTIRAKEAGILDKIGSAIMESFNKARAAVMAFAKLLLSAGLIPIIVGIGVTIKKMFDIAVGATMTVIRAFQSLVNVTKRVIEAVKNLFIFKAVGFAMRSAGAAADYLRDLLGFAPDTKGLENETEALKENTKAKEENADVTETKIKRPSARDNRLARVKDLAIEQRKQIGDLTSAYAKYLELINDAQLTENQATKARGQSKKILQEKAAHQKEMAALALQEANANMEGNSVVEERLQKEQELAAAQRQQEEFARQRKDQGQKEFSEEAHRVEAAMFAKIAGIKREILKLTKQEREEAEKTRKEKEKEADALKKKQRDNTSNFKIRALKVMAGETDASGNPTERAKMAKGKLAKAEDRKSVNQMVEAFKQTLDPDMDPEARRRAISTHTARAEAIIGGERSLKDLSEKKIGDGIGGVSSLAKIGGGGGIGAGDLEVKANALRQRAAIAMEKTAAAVAHLVELQKNGNENKPVGIVRMPAG